MLRRRRGIVAELAGYTPCRLRSGDRHGPPIIFLPQLAAHPRGDGRRGPTAVCSPGGVTATASCYSELAPPSAGLFLPAGDEPVRLGPKTSRRLAGVLRGRRTLRPRLRLA
jgi:hypothetical protein